MIEFSIIIPIYNSEKYISEAIESVKKQTYDSWELILIDDGSTDRSGVICDQYAEDPQIKVLHFDNAGQTMSRIRGIEEAKGEYLLVIDSDDFLDNNCLEKVKKAINASKCDMILFGYRLFGDDNKNVAFPLEPLKVYNNIDLIKQVILYTNHGLCNKVVKTKIVQLAVPSMITSRLSLNGDYAQIIPILCYIKSGYVMNDILYNYRIHNASISHNFKLQHIIDTDFVTESVIHLLNQFSILTRDMEDYAYIAYCKMISGRLFSLLSEKKLTKEECQMIHELNIYKKIKKFETIKYLAIKDAVTLKLFRKRLYWIFSIYFWGASKCK